MTPLSSFIGPWRERLISSDGRDSDEIPNYHLNSAVDSLITSAYPHSFELGTGASIYTNSLLPAISKAQHEVILVTCFWASSATLAALKDTLEQLALQRKLLIQAHGPDAPIAQPLRIRICFSSRSLLQKLFHTSSKDGYVYPPSTWSTQLGLPSQEVLEAGAIDMRIKSLFFLPFSVMHPKFLIVDRQRAWLPSCNVSWEPWLEGCVEITGDAVGGLVGFYQSVWDQGRDSISSDRPNITTSQATALDPIGLSCIQSPARRFSPIRQERTPAVILPSSHHQNPRFRPFPWLAHSAPPSTPLNVAVLRLFEMAEESIFLQTPNLTSAAVIDGILEALRRGIDVNIVTSKGMMLVEQVITAGTTTARCLSSLTRRYKNLRAEDRRRDPRESSGARHAVPDLPDLDLEAGIPKLGSLNISYFRANVESRRKGVPEEPVHSHLKLTIVDSQYTVLGSGNMDRASWFTSQELGILFRSPSFAKVVIDTVLDVLEGRTDTVFDSQQN
jgi:phosphatidylserine/phosphatidylglycerophosphate/cardiolipin synthase-like enzyme